MPNTDDVQSQQGPGASPQPPAIDLVQQRFPFCIVWTPIPLLTWLLPIVGHMGICTAGGVIRDFAGSYYVSEGHMAFGKPTKYWQLDGARASACPWDRAVAEASDVYKTRMHNLCCDNCHSHVALALNLMHYDARRDYNMINLCFGMLVHSKYVSCGGFLRTWLPFGIICLAMAVVAQFLIQN